MSKLDFIDKDLTIKDPPDFTVVSTFSGCGGSSTGYVWAGGKVLLAVEWDNNAVETYRLNYPNTDIYHGDIAKLSVEEVLERTGLQVGELDIFDGSPPCQGFSTAGKRMLDDERNQLFREYVRLLKGLQPKVMVMENVSGMVKGKMKLLFAEILTDLKNAGYRVKAKLLDAQYLGVPQRRQRIIFIGVRDDLGIEPSHPKPMTRPIAVKTALHDIQITMFAPIEKGQDVVLPHIKQGLGAKQSVPKSILKEYIPRMVNNTTYSFHGICRRLDPNLPAWTLTKQYIAYSETPIHYSENRFIAGDEARRLQSFPDCYRFVGQYKQWIARIGNSVPPRMMQYIAEHIRDHILSKIDTKV